MLLISPSLAQTIGLEEALLLQLLQEAQAFSGGESVVFTEQQRENLTPFWSLKQFTLVLERLSLLGLIKSEGHQPWVIKLENLDITQPPEPTVPTPVVHQQPIKQPAQPKPKPGPQIETQPQAQHSSLPIYSMNDARRRNQADEDLAYLKQFKPQASSVANRKSRMTNDWEPSEDFPQLLSFHDIPLQFALSELAKFRQYYSATDRTEISWDVRYLNWVQRSWHDSLNSKGRHDRQNTAAAGKPADSAREQRNQVRDALRNIRDTDW